MTDQGYPPRRPGQPGRYGRSRTSQQPGRPGWQTLDAFDPGAESESDVPPWAIPGGIKPIRPARKVQREPWPGPAAEPKLAEPGFDETGSGESGPAEDDSGQSGYGRPDYDERGYDHDSLGETGPPSERAPRRLAGRLRLSGRSRAAAARRRRSRRRLVTWGAVGVIGVLVAGVIIALNQPATVKSPFVTTLQKGELSTVPDACRVISSATLSQYLPGTRRSIQPFNGPQQSQCSYTVDARPTFRVLNATMQAYQPAGYIAAGDGSGTANAAYTYGQQREKLIKPAKNAAEPPATISAITGLGQEALAAVQIFHTGSVTAWVTVLVRYRNVLITASLEAQESDGFGPVSVGELRAGAVAVARQLLTAVQAMPTVG